MNKWYTVYKGDEFICQGTRLECARYLNVKPDTISFMTAPIYKKRRGDSDNSLIVLVTDDEEEDMFDNLREE